MVLIGALAPAAVDAGSSTDEAAISQLATHAAELVAEEMALIEAAAPGNADVDAAQDRLRQVDRQGAAVLLQLDQLGVELSSATRAALERLPDPSNGQPAMLPPVVYEAAQTDLSRVAATPAATIPTTSGGNSLGVLVAVAGLLLAGGGYALTRTLRRRNGHAELAAYAWSDGLTGVGNRRRLDHDLAAHADSATGHTAVIMVDIDNFKAINDRHGHAAGDEVLRQIGSVLSRQIRRDDVVYRYGGEEFCILLPAATPADGVAIGDRIVAAAREVTLPDGDHVTVSVGVADGAPSDVVATLADADRALYTAKTSGRDRRASASELVTA